MRRRGICNLQYHRILDACVGPRNLVVTIQQVLHRTEQNPPTCAVLDSNLRLFFLRTRDDCDMLQGNFTAPSLQTPRSQGVRKVPLGGNRQRTAQSRRERLHVSGSRLAVHTYICTAETTCQAPEQLSSLLAP